MSQILKNIKALRELKGFSQQGVADKLGITQSSYARFENGAKKTDFQLLREIAALFKVDVCDIIRFHEKGEGGGNYPAGYGTSGKNTEVKRMKDREQYLEKLNEQLLIQVRDKNEIIELLKSNNNSKRDSDIASNESNEQDS